jgi:hypothetical protein
MQTFQMTLVALTGRQRKPRKSGPVEFTPLRVEVAGVKHELALHKVNAGWRVSDPKSGCKVLNVNGSYLGIRTSTDGRTKAEIKALAVHQVLALSERVGPEAFNARLATA